MNTLLGLICLAALVAGLYFLVRVIIALMRGQIVNYYVKRMLIALLVVIVSVVGVSLTHAPKQTASRQEIVATEQKSVEEKRIAEETIAEEKRLAEEKAAEEKRLAEQQAVEERRISLREYGVQLDYTIEKLAEHKYKVIATTNLPDGMKLSISLSNRWIFRREVMGIPDEENYDMSPIELQNINQNTFTGQSKQIVKHGTFEATFSNANKLLPGRYEIEILSLLASLQPEDVQEILGVKGQNLFGTGVVESDIFKGERLILFVDEVYLP